MNQQVNHIEGDFVLEDARYAIICSRFNELIVSKLEAAAIDTLKRHGTELGNIDVIYVPGAHELPIAAQRLAATGRYEAIIALGAVIRGSTAHFDVVVNESSKGLGQIALKHDLPVLNGVLTTNSIEQAIERAGTKAGNKGAEAALAAIEMVSLLRQIN